jgi:Domain of unknown function (DUF6946)
MPQLFFGPDESPLSKPTDVIRFLGKQDKHWHKERSAYQAAHSWFLENGLPPSICSILRTASVYDNASLQKAVFERKTRLDSFGRESQTDVMAFVKIDGGQAVLGIEAKVDESFGPLVHEWNDYSPGKLRRLAGLLDRLELKSDSIGSLRYQLFHRTAATLIEAEAAGASQAAMIVQSFDGGRAGFSDFVAFVGAMGIPIDEPGKLSPPKRLGEIALRLGWTENQKQYSED